MSPPAVGGALAVVLAAGGDDVEQVDLAVAPQFGAVGAEHEGGVEQLAVPGLGDRPAVDGDRFSRATPRAGTRRRGPPGSLLPGAGSVSAWANLVSRSPPRQVHISGRLTRSGRSAATASSIRRPAWAMLAALSAPGLIWTTLTRMGCP